MPLPQATPPTDQDELLWAQDEFLARLFASSPRFQTEVGAADTEGALSHVIDWADTGDHFEKSRILIRMDGGLERKQQGLDDWRTSGTISVQIERRQDTFEESNDNYRTSKAEFRAFYSKILKEVENKIASRESILGFNPINVIEYRLAVGPWMTPTTETTQYDESDPATTESQTQTLVWWVIFDFEVY